ncbi:MAG: cobalt-precorrin-5B (C(1))-methyltransferase CbiD [Agathobacter sp.]|nr:cobalt-precorrin-5B (C(1))-methyltransferase CbiD [Agathobacter sp.]
MRYGFTTGSCAAAASKAAAYMLLSGNRKEEISIQTPKGITFTATVLDIDRKENCVSCAVQKDGGDDPDITTGALIYATVSVEEADRKEPDEQAQIVIDGGNGVGRVTKPGLDQPVGNAAINHVPREMITKEVLEVCKLFDYKGRLLVVISVPAGESLAAQTFNPRLGIVGGISILGTSGIVEPMSNQAILDTIRVELRQRRSLGFDYVAVAPGNYGLDYMKNTYGYDLDRSVKCSNFIGATIDMAVELGFQRLLLTGHIGKLVKLSGGIMNTHSSEGDCRMELLTAFAAKFGADSKTLKKIMECVTTEEAVRVLKECGLQQAVMDYTMERICYYLQKRAKQKLQIDCIMYANEFGELAKSRGAEQWFTLLEQEQEQQI